MKNTSWCQGKKEGKKKKTANIWHRQNDRLCANSNNSGFSAILAGKF